MMVKTIDGKYVEVVKLYTGKNGLKSDYLLFGKTFNGHEVIIDQSESEETLKIMVEEAIKKSGGIIASSILGQRKINDRSVYK